MTPNMGMIDRLLRIVVAAAIAVLYVMGYITGVWAYVLGIVAVALVLTSVFGYCPLYAPFGFSTKERTLSGR